jgi:hypothetical protein
MQNSLGSPDIWSLYDEATATTVTGPSTEEEDVPVLRMCS